MTQAELLETIRAEIERRFWDYGTPLHDEEVTKKVDEILDLLALLDTLQEPNAADKKAVKEIVETAEDHAYFAGQENLREKVLELVKEQKKTAMGFAFDHLKLLEDKIRKI